MSEEIKPVLTAEEWERAVLESLDGYVDLELGIVDVRIGGPAGSRDDARDARLLAAILLRHAGPDGGPLLTARDVVCLEVAADFYAGSDRERGAASLRDLADRLASLLPPREP